MKDPEWLVPAGLQLAFLALGARDFNEVVEITGRILEREPENVSALLMRANAYAHWKKDPELALADANRALELDPDTLEAFEPRILALLDLGRLEEASEALAEAGRRLVELEAARTVLAWHCSTTAAFEQESGDLERARETWIACLDAHPTDLEVLSSAMSFYDAQGEPDRSLEVLRAALAGAPASRFLRVALSQRLRLSPETPPRPRPCCARRRVPRIPSSPPPPGWISASSARPWASTAPQRMRWNGPSSWRERRAHRARSSCSNTRIPWCWPVDSFAPWRSRKTSPCRPTAS